MLCVNGLSKLYDLDTSFKKKQVIGSYIKREIYSRMSLVSDGRCLVCLAVSSIVGAIGRRKEAGWLKS